jgi:hypothetical protein
MNLLNIIIYIFYISFPKILSQTIAPPQINNNNNNSNDTNTNNNNNQKNSSICDLRIAKTKDDSIKGLNNLYLSDGTISKEYILNTGQTYNTPDNINQETLYFTEKKDSQYKIGITIESSNNEVSLPSFISEEISNNDLNLVTNSLTISYNCNKILKDSVFITLKMNPTGCNPFQLEWKKNCKGEEFEKTPKINLIIKKNGKIDYIVNNGEINYNNNLLNKDFSQSHLINENRLVFSISKMNEFNYKVKQITINNIDNYDNKLITPFIDGLIGIVGGELNNYGSDFAINFNCLYNKNITNDFYSNFKVEINFENNQNLVFYLSKICKIPKIKLIIRFLYFLYWIFLLILITFLIFIISLFYSTKGDDFNFKEFLIKFKEKILDNFFMVNLNFVDNYHENENDNKNNINNNNLKQTQMDYDDEEEVLNIKFSIEKNEENNNNNNNSNDVIISNTKDYGGI